MSISWDSKLIGNTDFQRTYRSTCKCLKMSVSFTYRSITATACPGGAMRIETTEIDAFQKELAAKNYKYYRPGIEEMPWGSRDMSIVDPFGNRLTFFLFPSEG